MSRPPPTSVSIPPAAPHGPSPPEGPDPTPSPPRNRSKSQASFTLKKKKKVNFIPGKQNTRPLPPHPPPTPDRPGSAVKNSGHFPFPEGHSAPSPAQRPRSWGQSLHKSLLYSESSSSHDKKQGGCARAAARSSPPLPLQPRGPTEGRGTPRGSRHPRRVTAPAAGHGVSAVSLPASGPLSP